MLKKLIVFFLFLSIVGASAQEITLSDLQRTNEALKAKETELAAKEQELNAREERIKGMEAEIIEKEEELSKMRGEITELLNSLNTESDKELDQLAKLYGSTKAKSAAAIFIKMEIPKSAALLRRMTAMNAGRLMAEIAKQDAKYASDLTTYMVGEDPATVKQATESQP
jgi:flagellar motility protein MotE (MotC chaperone)